MRFASDKDRLACDRFFVERAASRAVFDTLVTYVDALANDDVTLASTKSRVAFVRSTRFAWVHTAVLDGSVWLAFLSPTLVTSPRVRCAPVGKRFSTHLKVAKLDAEVKRWLKSAYEADA